MRKDLSVTSAEDAKRKIPDLKVYGDAYTWVCLCKASSESQGWMKSTKVMNVPGGCVVQVTTQQINDASMLPNNTIAEALTYVPGAKIKTDIDGKPFLGV